MLGVSGASAQEVVRNMDLTVHPHNGANFISDHLAETEMVLLPILAEQHIAGPAVAVERLHLSSSVRCEVGRRLADVSEAREAKIRELQNAIKNETYHVTAEQIADKMLRSALRDDLT
jgi:hypothetical protein